MMKDLSEAQAAAVRRIPGMERPYTRLAKRAKGRGDRVRDRRPTDPQRWAKVKGHMVKALPQQADLLRKKMRLKRHEAPSRGNGALSPHQGHGAGGPTDNGDGEDPRGSQAETKYPWVSPPSRAGGQRHAPTTHAPVARDGTVSASGVASAADGQHVVMNDGPAPKYGGAGRENSTGRAEFLRAGFAYI